MNTVVRLDDHRPIDPVENEEIRKLLRAWYRFSIGGTVGYGPVILTPFLANPKTDPLYELRYTMPKVMLVLQPTVKAWADGEVCNLDYVQAAVHNQPKMVVREWLTTCCEVGVIKMEEVGSEVCYQPTRGVIYRVLEIMINLHDCIHDLENVVPRAFEALKTDRDWVPVDVNLPQHYKQDA